ncbi:MAG: hypothetical protein E7165_04000 [Firmicutes bacterium]|nr:hypothetical protein [Bacillota bacterium]
MNQRIWTQEQDNYIKENFGKVSFSEMENHMGCAITTIQRRAVFLGLDFETKSLRRWTKEEEELLREYSKKYVTKTIAKKLGRSYLAVQKKAVKLGIELHSERDPWKKWMIDYLKDNINKKPIGEIENMLGLSYRRILTKCKELGIEYRVETWTQEEIEILREYAPRCHYTELTKILPNRSVGAISAKAYELGIETISQHKKLDDASIEYIKENWGKIPATQIARNLKISIGMINRYKKELELPNTGQQKKWTEEIIESLRKDALTKDRKSLAKKYNTSCEQISKIAYENNIVLLDSKKVWDDSKDDELIRLVNEGLSIAQISDIMEIKANLIRTRIKLLKINYVSQKRTFRKWSEEETLLLLELLGSYSTFEVARMLNRSEEQVCVYAKKLGYEISSKHRRWTEEEESMLKDLWGNLSIEKIAKKLNRTESAIINRANVLNLGSQFSNNYDGLRIQEISDMFLINRMTILNSWVALGLKLDYRKMSNNRVYAFVSIENLYAFLEQNQNIWDSRVLEKNILGKEPEWLVEKRKTDNERTFENYNLSNLNKQQLLNSKKYFLDINDQNFDTKEQEIGPIKKKTKI